MLWRLTKKTADEGAERYRKAILTSAMNMGSQGIQLITGLVSVPLALNHLGLERFGIWMTLSAALAFIAFSDFGVGIGTQDRISRLAAAGSYDEARRTFSSSLFFVAGLAILLLGIGWLLVPRIGLAALFSIKSELAAREIIPTALVVVLVFALGLVAGVIQRAYSALQEGFLIALIQAASRLLSLLLLFAVVSAGMSLPVLVFVVGGISSAAVVVIGMPILLRRHRWIWPGRVALAEQIDRGCLHEVLKVGVLGLGASAAIYLVNSSALVLISAKFDAESSADYAVLLKLVSIPLMVLTYALIPLWPAVSEANAKRDYLWIALAYKNYRRVTLGAAFISASGLLLFGRDAISIWTQNPSVIPSAELLLAVIVFMILGFWNALISVFLNGLSLYKSQATVGLLTAAAFASLAAIIPVELGKELIIWTVAVGYFLRCVVMQVQVSSFMSTCSLRQEAEK